MDCREDHESGIAGGRYRDWRQRVSQPQPTDRNAQLTWCWRRTPWGTSAKFRERQWQTSVQSVPFWCIDKAECPLQFGVVTTNQLSKFPTIVVVKLKNSIYQVRLSCASIRSNLAPFAISRSGPNQFGTSIASSLRDLHDYDIFHLVMGLVFIPNNVRVYPAIHEARFRRITSCVIQFSTLRFCCAGLCLESIVKPFI